MVCKEVQHGTFESNNRTDFFLNSYNILTQWKEGVIPYHNVGTQAPVECIPNETLYCCFVVLLWPPKKINECV